MTGTLKHLMPRGQNLSQHVHLHCLIPAGAFDSAQQWHQVKQRRGQLMCKDWVVAKPCLHKAETVVQYLARYTRKMPLANPAC